MAWADRSKPSGMPPLKTDLSSQVTCGKNFCYFDSSTLALDDIAAKGDVHLMFGEKTPLIEAKLSTGPLNLDPFMDAGKAGVRETKEGKMTAVAAAPVEAGRGWDRTPYDLSAMHALNVRIAMQAESLSARNIKVGKVAFVAELKDAHATFNMS